MLLLCGCFFCQSIDTNKMSLINMVIHEGSMYAFYETTKMNGASTIHYTWVISLVGHLHWMNSLLSTKVMPWRTHSHLQHVNEWSIHIGYCLVQNATPLSFIPSLQILTVPCKGCTTQLQHLMWHQDDQQKKYAQPTVYYYVYKEIIAMIHFQCFKLTPLSTKCTTNLPAKQPTNQPRTKSPKHNSSAPTNKPVSMELKLQQTLQLWFYLQHS